MSTVGRANVAFVISVRCGVARISGHTFKQLGKLVGDADESDESVAVLICAFVLLQNLSTRRTLPK